MRDGSYPKTLRTEVGEVTVQVPRDREGSFEPTIVAKRQKRLSGFDEAVISSYAKGRTTGDIANQLAEVYDTEISRGLVSRVTDAVTADLQSWKTRPLERVYPVVLIDAIHLKIREDRSGTGRSTSRSGSIWMGSVTCWDVDRSHWRGGREAVDEHAARSAQPWCRGLVHRVL